jgi:antitoxin component YwqK of YwqJK toxin-antitoxin module
MPAHTRPTLPRRLRFHRLLPATLLLAAGWAHAVQDCELNGEQVNPANGNTTAGKTGLMRCKERDTGELRREQELRNGVFMGLVRFYEKGQLAKEYSVNEKGNQQGLAREFSPTGQVLRESTQDNGRTVGLARSFHPDGTLRRAAFHAPNGQEQAEAEFTAQGKLQSLRCAETAVLAPAVDDARLCGFGNAAPSTVELFDGRGTVRTRMQLAAGKRLRVEDLHDNGKVAVLLEIGDSQRSEKRYTSDGALQREITSRTTERGSIRQREAEFSDRGTLVREQRWSPEGEPLTNDTYYLNGQPRSKAVYSGSGASREVEVTTYFDNGQRSGAGRFTVAERGGRQSPTGAHQRFNEQGTRMSESTFDTQGRLRRERSWGGDGKPLRDDEVFEDGSRKAYTAR